MTISAYANFDAELPWYGGSGCLVCRSNHSPNGLVVGIQCVDLGVMDDFMGELGLCYDCALQVALAIGSVPRADLDRALNEAEEVREAAVVTLEEARIIASEARLDRDVVERLAGSLYNPQIEGQMSLVDA